MLKDFIRKSLITLDVGDTASFPLTNIGSAHKQMEDLKLFHGYLFKGHVDKTRRELEVTRLK